jgi:hypothetical protein
MEYQHSDITEKIISAFYAVYNKLGYGFLEKVYRNAMALEIQESGLGVAVESPINVYYNDQVVGEYFADHRGTQSGARFDHRPRGAIAQLSQSYSPRDWIAAELWPQATNQAQSVCQPAQRLTALAQINGTQMSADERG